MTLTQLANSKTSDEFNSSLVKMELEISSVKLVKNGQSIVTFDCGQRLTVENKLLE